MAISITATVGGTTSNSYLTLADAQTLIDGWIEDDNVVAWGTATTDQKNRALYSATQRIDRERFIGGKATNTQALQWPRDGVKKPDTHVYSYVQGFPFSLTADYYTTTEIPSQVKEAQAVLAVYLNNNKSALGLSGLEDFQNVKLGSIDVTPNLINGAIGADKVPPLFERFFTGLRISGPGNIAIKRS